MSDDEPGAQASVFDGLPKRNGMTLGTRAAITVVIPTYGRDRVLVDTLEGVLTLEQPPSEIIVVDQTERHDTETDRWLTERAGRGEIRWIRLKWPSIPAAMNRGLLAASNEVVLFLDDDIRPGSSLASAHARAHERGEHLIIAGRVIQPWHEADGAPLNGFAGTVPGAKDEFIGCNFSVRRDRAISLGGFDERFVRVAYRFEAEFASRVRAAGGSVWFEPAAVVHHLKALTGGTRSFGHHLRTVSPAHSVGEYYYLLCARPALWHARLLGRPWRSIATRHHLKRPWWILPTLIGEVLGLVWALSLWRRGPKLIRADWS